MGFAFCEGYETCERALLTRGMPACTGFWPSGVPIEPWPLNAMALRLRFCSRMRGWSSCLQPEGALARASTAAWVGTCL